MCGCEGRGGVKKDERFILLPSLHSLAFFFCQLSIQHSTVSAKIAALDFCDIVVSEPKKYK